MHKRRQAKGSQLTEFGAALVFFFFVVLLPTLDFAILPVRYMIAQQIINSHTRQLALCEKFSDASRLLEQNQFLIDQLKKISGVEVKSLTLRLKVTRIFSYPHADESISVTPPEHVPPAWLPTGNKAPCNYTLQLDSETMIAPAILVPAIGMTIPGLNAPVNFTITGSRQWENTGRDPVSKRFFFDE